MTSISVFFSCYNDVKTIGTLVVNAKRVLKKLTTDFEIIVIDDGSVDNSRQVLLQLSRGIKELKLVFHDINRGYGAVLQTGFKTVSKDLVFYTDGDGQYDVAELDILFRLMTDDISFVQGIKLDRQDYSYRVTIGNLYAFVMRWLFMLDTWDVDCDFRLMRKWVVKKVHLTCNSGAVCVELVKKAQSAGAKFRHVGIHHFARVYGKSQFFKTKRILQTVGEIILLWFTLVLFSNS